MTHCQRCRADACGLLCEGTTQETMNLLQEASNAPIRPDEDRPYVAVATREGVLVNLHLGEAEEFQIYGHADGEFMLVDTRKAPPRGCGDTRWLTMARWLGDCRAVLVSSAGPKPTDALMQAGIKVVVMEGLIDEALSAIYKGQEVKAPVRAFKCGQGVTCGGDGGGCG
jgi:nitrogen fixation protein NifB